MSFLKKMFIAPFVAGRAYSKLNRGQYDEAIPLFKKIIAIDPDHYRNGYELINLAHCYYEIGKNPEALKYFELAYQLFQKSDNNFISDMDDRRMIDYCIKKYILLLKNDGQNRLAKKVENSWNTILSS